MTDASPGVLKTLDKWGRRTEDAVLALLLLGMMVLATLQIVLRNVFDSGLIWADELLRLTVLWVALVGAIAASRADKQISINVLSRFLPERLRLAVSVVVDLFTAFVCGLLAWHSGRFVHAAWEFEDTLLGGLPAWWFEIILPVGFGLMAWRYLVFTVSKFLLAARHSGGSA